MNEELLDKIDDKSLVVGVIGLGYVGLPLAREVLKSGFKVIGFDVDLKKVDLINKGKTYIKHISDDFLKEYVVEKKRFFATTDFQNIKETDMILICVPTPLDKHNNPDLKYVIDTTTKIKENLREGHVVVLESTTYPGTTEEVLKKILEESGLKEGKDFYLGYSPEREDPGNKKFNTKTIPKIVSSITKEGLAVIEKFYGSIIDNPVPVSSCKVAEAAKILENIYRAVNIALVNELKMIFDRMDINVWEVIDAAKTKPFGFNAFYPGPGLGGHCIPIDPFYLTYKAKEFDYNTKFIELAGEINTYQPYYVIQRVLEILDENNKTLKDAKILVLGVAYKKDIDDLRESPSIKIIDLLKGKGAFIDYYDPYIKEVGNLRHYPELKINSINYNKDKLKEYDLILLTTDHSDFNYKEILENANLIVDTRNAFPKNKKVYRA
jgi:UDP-N-acetyl-D-glucosamine dehydrogenase